MWTDMARTLPAGAGQLVDLTRDRRRAAGGQRHPGIPPGEQIPARRGVVEADHVAGALTDTVPRGVRGPELPEPHNVPQHVLDRTSLVLTQPGGHQPPPQRGRVAAGP